MANANYIDRCAEYIYVNQLGLQSFARTLSVWARARTLAAHTESIHYRHAIVMETNGKHMWTSNNSNGSTTQTAQIESNLKYAVPRCQAPVIRIRFSLKTHTHTHSLSTHRDNNEWMEWNFSEAITCTPSHPIAPLFHPFFSRCVLVCHFELVRFISDINSSVGVAPLPYSIWLDRPHFRSSCFRCDENAIYFTAKFAYNSNSSASFDFSPFSFYAQLCVCVCGAAYHFAFASLHSPRSHNA